MNFIKRYNQEGRPFRWTYTPTKLPTATIVRRQDFADGLFKIWLETEIPFTFKPGQYITIGSQGIERPYSIASAPYEDHIELFIRLVPAEDGGKLTPLLSAQQVGDIVSMRPRAKGIFTMERQHRNQVMVGTVTGVTPYVSIVRQYLRDGQTGHRFFVMEGANHRDEFGYDEELASLAAKHPGMLTFVPTVSMPHDQRNQGWTGSTGRVNTIVEEHLDAWGLSKDETIIYLCGNPGMIADVKLRLGSERWNITEERFWKAEEE